MIKLFLIRFDFTNIVDSQPNNSNISKLNTINQSIFINDIILSILSKQLNETNLNDLNNTLTLMSGNSSSNNNNKNDEDLLIIDDFVEQQQQQIQQQQSTEVLPR